MALIDSFSGVQEIYGRIIKGKEGPIGYVQILTDDVVTIYFDSPQQLTNFCKTHNIRLEDKRNEKQ